MVELGFGPRSVWEHPTVLRPDRKCWVHPQMGTMFQLMRCDSLAVLLWPLTSLCWCQLFSSQTICLSSKAPFPSLSLYLQPSLSTWNARHPTWNATAIFQLPVSAHSVFLGWVNTWMVSGEEERAGGLRWVPKGPKTKLETQEFPVCSRKESLQGNHVRPSLQCFGKQGWDVVLPQGLHSWGWQNDTAAAMDVTSLLALTYLSPVLRAVLLCSPGCTCLLYTSPSPRDLH